MHEARREAESIVTDNYNGERELSKVLILGVVEELHAPVRQWYSDASAREELMGTVIPFPKSSHSTAAEGMCPILHTILDDQPPLPPSSVELWALATTAEDVALRKAVTKRMGFRAAWQRLAAAFPAGTAQTEIRSRMTCDGGKDIKEAVASLIREIGA